jgi:hypothetical protein
LGGQEEDDSVEGERIRIDWETNAGRKFVVRQK